MNFKHGDTHTRFYNIWYGVLLRCDNPETRYYKNGITVCNRWKDYNNFKKDMYDKYIEHCKECGEQNTSIDRINTYGNYEPSNCRWATDKEQSLNKTNNTTFNVNGENFTMSELCEIYKLKVPTFLKRLQLGWDIEKILSIPVERGQRTKQQQIIYKNVIKTIKEWSELTNLSQALIRNRINRGWSIEKALNFYKIEEEI